MFSCCSLITLCEMLITVHVGHVTGGTLMCTRASHNPFQEQTGLCASEEALLHAVACMPEVRKTYRDKAECTKETEVPQHVACYNQDRQCTMALEQTPLYIHTA